MKVTDEMMLLIQMLDDQGLLHKDFYNAIMEIRDSMSDSKEKLTKKEKETFQVLDQIVDNILAAFDKEEIG